MSNILAGQRIREMREMKSYSRDALAEIVAGKKGFSADVLCRLSKALSVSCDYIMLGEEKEHYGMEKVICVLEMVEPKQRSRMQDILQILYDMCANI